MTYIPCSSDFALISWRVFDVYTSNTLQDYFLIISRYEPKFNLKTKLFTVTFILQSSDFTLYLEKFRIMNPYDPKFDFKINVGLSDLYFAVQWFCPISWRVSCVNIILSDYESVWPEVWLWNKCRSHWPLFHSPMILPFILKSISCINTYFQIIVQYHPVLAQNKWHSDLYFTVQWLNFILWRIFWWVNIILLDYESVGPQVWHKNE